MRGNALLIGFIVSLVLVWSLAVVGSLAVFSGYPLAVRAHSHQAPPAPVEAPAVPCRVAAVSCPPSSL